MTGPTGVGKTELCLSLAEHYGVEIINADSRQIFRGLPIGTAAPTAEQMQRVRHYFVATKQIGEYYSASMYEQDVLKLIEEKGSNKSPIAILTGGSMMYIDAVCNGIDDIPTVRDDIRSLMKERLAKEGLAVLTEELHEKDPEHWMRVDRQNPRRVVHALEICYQTGRPYSSFRTGEKKPRPFHTIKIGLTRDREELYNRINERVLKMIEQGLEEEARQHIALRNENGLNTVGYKEMFRYFDGLIDLPEAIRQIQSHTREYARKQLTWYKRDPEMRWFSPDDINGIINHIDEKLQEERI